MEVLKLMEMAEAAWGKQEPNANEASKRKLVMCDLHQTSI
jgi:hypothetical protein